ncbi:ORF5 [Ranid herpesvirus 2]|uniref:ORF5 n=1 Tax=Ranid herpesvirus 2 TaxID=389214 RepID=Q14WA1_9VIRU|nr:ORF5 [Ranid herpesvirus 2]ABG25562.1 ORF5 [Ranid herpesvirus 2]
MPYLKMIEDHVAIKCVTEIINKDEEMELQRKLNFNKNVSGIPVILNLANKSKKRYEFLIYVAACRNHIVESLVKGMEKENMPGRFYVEYALRHIKEERPWIGVSPLYRKIASLRRQKNNSPAAAVYITQCLMGYNVVEYSKALTEHTCVCKALAEYVHKGADKDFRRIYNLYSCLNHYLTDLVKYLDTRGFAFIHTYEYLMNQEVGYFVSPQTEPLKKLELFINAKLITPEEEQDSSEHDSDYSEDETDALL